ncbi:4590_t:CDS:2, partial [Funneliformis geosporum]
YLVVLIIIIMLTFHYIAADRTGVHAFGLDGDNPKLPESLARSKHKIVFVGPPGLAMRSLGDKISSTIAANVPTMDWSGNYVTLMNKVMLFFSESVYEVPCVKDVQAFAQIQGEVPGSPTFITRLAPDARHLEVQVLAVQYGNAISLFGRDCSHPTTEMAQLQIAMGIPLHQIRDIRVLYGLAPSGTSEIDFDFSDPESLQTQRRPAPKGHVITVRITAENPDAGFKPSSGMVHELNFRSSTNV